LDFSRAERSAGASLWTCTWVSTRVKSGTSAARVTASRVAADVCRRKSLRVHIPSTPLQVRRSLMDIAVVSIASQLLTRYAYRRGCDGATVVNPMMIKSQGSWTSGSILERGAVGVGIEVLDDRPHRRSFLIGGVNRRGPAPGGRQSVAPIRMWWNALWS